MGQRPPHLKPPADLPPNPPVPAPKPIGARPGSKGGRDPTRYGDWELKGVAVDF